MALPSASRIDFAAMARSRTLEVQDAVTCVSKSLTPTPIYLELREGSSLQENGLSSVSLWRGLESCRSDISGSGVEGC